MCWVLETGRVLACWFRSSWSYYRKGHTLRCYLRVQGFSFSGLVACSHAGFSRTDLSIAICVCNVLGFRDWSRARMRFSFERFLLPTRRDNP